MHKASEAEEFIDEDVLFIDDVFTDGDIIEPSIEVRKISDPFKSIDVTKRNKEIKKSHAILSKRLKGVDGAESKYIDPSTVNGYELYELVAPPYDLGYLGILFEEHAILRAVVEARVMNTVGLGWTWKPTLKARKQIERASSVEERAKNLRSKHQAHIEGLNETFDAMNEEETFNDVLIRAWMDALVLGTGYIEIGRTTTNSIGFLGHVPGATVRIRKARDGFVQTTGAKEIFFRNFGDKDTKDPINGDPRPNELVPLKIYSPNNTFYGIPPSVAAISAIVGDKFAKEYNIDYFENKAIPRYAIIVKGAKLGVNAKKEILQYFRKQVKGKNHGTILIPLPSNLAATHQPEIEFKALENDIQDSSFDSYRKTNKGEIISVYRVPPTKVGVLDGANLAVSRDADKTFKVQVIAPDQVMIQKRINRIVSEFTDLFKLEFNQLDIIDEDMKSRIHDRYLRTEVLSPNEVRIEIGKEPIEGGDKVLPYPVKAKMEADAKAGAPVGNTNSQASSPPKSGQDNGTNVSSADATATNAERGQVQDTAGTRERK